MRGMPRPIFPEGSLLAAMLGEAAPVEARRAAQRLRSEGAPALAMGDEVAALARGLALSEVSRSPVIPDALPPLFWLEVREGEDAPAIRGWAVEKRGDGLVARGFAVAVGPDAVPGTGATAKVTFPGDPREDGEAREVRGLVAAASLPEVLSQMGESSPLTLMPADAADEDAGSLRGFRLAVVVPTDAAG